MIQTSTYIRRRRTLLQKMEGQKGVAVFVGNIGSPAQYFDNCYKWRQDSNWLYFFGIDEPGFAAIIDLESGKETVYADDFTLDDIIWMGPMPAVSELAAEAGVACSDKASGFEAAVKAALASGRQVHFLPASRYANAIRLSSLLGFAPSEAFIASKAGCPRASQPLVKAVIEMRLVKDAEEIALMDDAGVLGQKMHTAARKGIRIGRIEQEIVGEMEGVTLAGGWGVSFPTILTQHGEIFHCHSHDCEVAPGRLMVVDAGAENNAHYASDFTRTYPTAGKFTSKQRDIYDIVYDCHQLSFSLTAPGVEYRSVHLAANRLMLERLSALGLVRGSVDDMMELGVAGLFMPHGLGHNIGLDTHDMEDMGENLVGYAPGQKRSALLGLGSLRMARPLQPGNIVTDEPGMYFIPDLIAQWEKDGTDRGHVNYDLLRREYLDFGGIRIEDDVLVTEDGARRTGGKRLPASSAEVEEAMAMDIN